MAGKNGKHSKNGRAGAAPAAEPLYRWGSPLEWLYDRITRLMIADDAVALANDFRCVADKLDADDVQDVFQDDMARDGYFQELRPAPAQED